MIEKTIEWTRADFERMRAFLRKAEERLGDPAAFPWTPGEWAIDNGSEWDLDNPPRKGHVVCSVEKAFSTITVRAEPDHLACPPKEELDRIGRANAALICAAPKLARLLASAFAYLRALPIEARPDEAWIAPIREALEAAGHPVFKSPER